MDPQGDTPPAINRFKLALQVVVVAVGALVALWLVSRVAGPAGRANAPTGPTQPAGPNLDFGKPPSGVPLFYYIDHRQPTWLIASDWMGKPRGTVKRSPDDGVFPLYASPDGSSVVVGETIYAPDGRRVPTGQNGQGLAVWADDSRHMCGFGAGGDPAGAPGASDVLQTFLVGRLPVPVGPVGPVRYRAGVEVFACSFRSNRVLVVQRGPAPGIHEYWLIGLPAGTPIHHEVLAGDVGTSYTELVASANARYVAEVLMQPTESGPLPLAASIHDAASGAALARLDAGKMVMNFSADGESVLVAGPRTNEVSVIGWRTGRTLWTLSAKDLADPHEVLTTSIAKPGGGGFVLAFWRPQTGSCPGGSGTCTTADANPVQELLLAGVDGSRRIVARQVTLIGTG